MVGSDAGSSRQGDAHHAMYHQACDVVRDARRPCGACQSGARTRPLWRARCRAEMSLEDIARRTGFDVTILRAVEDSDFVRLRTVRQPNRVVTTYAKAVGPPQKWATRTWLAEAP